MFAEAIVGHRLKNRSRTIKISKKSESGVGDRQRRNCRFAGNKDHTHQAREDSPVDVIIQKRGKRDYAGRAEAFNSNERKNLRTHGFMGEKRPLRENPLVHGVLESKSSHRWIKKSQIDESSKKISGIKVPRSIWVSSGTHVANLERKGTRTMKKKSFSPTASDRKMNGKGETAERSGNFGMNRDHIDLLKKNSKSKLSEKKIKGSVTKDAKETLRVKKVMDDSEDKNNEPKRRKRIRLDPNDISNKRLDDDISLDESVKKKKEDGEKDDNLSKNAQFRAIQPSPSILSFVEENFLGRRREIELQRSGFNIDLSAPLDNIPFSTGPDRERIEESVFRNKLTFFAAAKVATSFPPPGLPEIAFAGRSNVGKSSLLNALTRQWGVVRTSDKPGLTQTINFFQLGSKLSLVDLPGYGFAYAKEEVKDAWEELVKEYVSTRVGLKRVCLLIDTKWGIKPRDHELIELMERSKTKYQVVLTKTDTVFPLDVARRAMQIEENLGAKKSIVQPLMMVSSKSGAGIRSLRSVLANIGRFARI